MFILYVAVGTSAHGFCLPSRVIAIKVHNGRHKCSYSLWPEVAHPQLNLSHECVRACLDASHETFNVIEKVLKNFIETTAYENILA